MVALEAHEAVAIRQYRQPLRIGATRAGQGLSVLADQRRQTGVHHGNQPLISVENQPGVEKNAPIANRGEPVLACDNDV